MSIFARYLGNIPGGGGGGGVSSLNSLTGALSLTAGTGITITPSGSNILISSSGGGGGIASINGDTTAAQVIVAGSGISVSSSSGTTTISNTLSAGANLFLSNLSSPTAINQNLLFGTDATNNIGAVGASRPKSIISSGIMQSGSYGAGLDPVTQGYGSGFWVSNNGNVLTRMFADPNIGYIGYTDQVNSGPANYGLVYDTSKPYQLGLGVNTNNRQVNFDFSALDNFYVDLSLNPSGSGCFAASNGFIGVPTYTWASTKTTGMYMVPNGMDSEPQIFFVGPGRLNGIAGQYSRGSIASNGDGGAGFFGNGYVGAEPTGNYAWNWDFGQSITKYQINGIRYSVQFESNGDLTFDNSFSGCNIGNATGGAPVSVYAQNLLLTTTASVLTPSAGVLTLTNGPGASTGNPAIYIKINVNGTNYAIPAFAY